MIHAQNTKKAILFHGSFTTGATAASGYVDTRGYDYCSMDIILDSVGATSNNLATCQIAESDDTVTSNFATVSGWVGDTDWTVPANNSQSAQVIAFDIDCRPRKRYLRLEAVPATTQILTGVATLSRADEAPSTTTEGGVIARVQG